MLKRRECPDQDVRCGHQGLDGLLKCGWKQEGRTGEQRLYERARSPRRRQPLPMPKLPNTTFERCRLAQLQCELMPRICSLCCRPLRSPTLTASALVSRGSMLFELLQRLVMRVVACIHRSELCTVTLRMKMHLCCLYTCSTCTRAQRCVDGGSGTDSNSRKAPDGKGQLSGWQRTHACIACSNHMSMNCHFAGSVWQQVKACIPLGALRVIVNDMTRPSAADPLCRAADSSDQEVSSDCRSKVDRASRCYRKSSARVDTD